MILIHFCALGVQERGKMITQSSALLLGNQVLTCHYLIPQLFSSKCLFLSSRDLGENALCNEALHMDIFLF